MAQCHVITDHAIMGDVRLGEERAIVAENGFRILFGSAMDGNIFADNVAVTDAGVGHGTGNVFEVLRLDAKGDERKYIAFLADGGMPVDHDVGTKGRVATDGGVGADCAERTDIAAVPDFRIGVYLSGFVHVNSHTTF